MLLNLLFSREESLNGDSDSRGRDDDSINYNNGSFNNFDISTFSLKKIEKREKGRDIQRSLDSFKTFLNYKGDFQLTNVF